MKKTLMLFCLFSFITANVFAEDLTGYKQIIEKTLKYPREAVYPLPAILPDPTKTEEENVEYMNVAKGLERMGEVMLSRKGGQVVLKPSQGNEDVIGREEDMNYNVVGLNLVMGNWSIQTANLAKNDSKYVVSGKKILKPSRLYDKLSAVFSHASLKEYSTANMNWIVEKVGEKYRVIERYAK